jgi:hypothetical protein
LAKPATQSQKRLAAAYLGLGYDEKKVRKLVHLSAQQLNRWLKQPEFVQAIEAAAEEHAEAVTQMLKLGEARAVQTLIDAMDAERPVIVAGSRFDNMPDWEIRTKAAMTFLDRKGERGRPTEQKTATITHNLDGDLAARLKAALADPGVQAKLKALPSVVNLLPQVMEAEEVDFEVVSDTPGQPAEGGVAVASPGE